MPTSAVYSPRGPLFNLTNQTWVIGTTSTVAVGIMRTQIVFLPDDDIEAVDERAKFQAPENASITHHHAAPTLI